ncbi:MAG: chorismate mutase [Rhodothermales bacterium]|nr:chorismate mutase [Rhodothermales bacterium]
MPADALRTALALLDAADPAPPDAPSEADLRPWRDRIDAIDRAVLHLLNERARSANVIGHIKKQLRLPVYAPRREEEVLRNVMESNRGPLPPTAVRHIFERIIDETRSLERHRYQDEPES